MVRGIAAVTGSALALSLALVPSAQAAPVPAPAGADPAPAARAAAYLAAQPQPNNIIKTFYEFPPGTFDSYDDYGLTIDAASALDAVGGNTAKVAAMTTALEANIGNYVFGGGTAAKMSSFLLSQGRTGVAVDDLVADLEDHIETAAPNTGRLVDPEDPMTPWDDDFNSPLTQAYAVSALNNAGSSLAGSALTFHLAQQCTAGFFRASFSAKADADQSCNGAVGPTPSVDTTGLTVILLQDQKSKPVVSAAITKALDWLVSQQAANGSFSSGNANATGLAGWALGISGRTAAAAKAAGWLRAHQLANAGTCTPYAAKDNGAVTPGRPRLHQRRLRPDGRRREQRGHPGDRPGAARAAVGSRRCRRGRDHADRSDRLRAGRLHAERRPVRSPGQHRVRHQGRHADPRRPGRRGCGHRPRDPGGGDLRP